MIGGFKQVIQNEGAGALLTGFGPTAAGYFLQGAFKFGGYEFFKQQCINQLGYETASNNRTAVYLASAGAAEFFADIALCPWEAIKVRMQTTLPPYAHTLREGWSKVVQKEGFGGYVLYYTNPTITFSAHVPPILIDLPRLNPTQESPGSMEPQT